MRHRAPDEPLFEFLSFGRRGPYRRDRLSPAQVEQIARTAGRTPEVMVKVLPSAANSVAAVRKHLAYVGRHGEVELQTDDGERLQAREAAASLTEDWDLDLAECQSTLGRAPGRPAPKLVHKLVFSMPAGTPSDKVLLATQAFCREQWALKHRYAMALHTDEPHPHVHVIVKAVSEQGERLDIRKATLREWREEFATQLRRVGVPANATPRVVRGETRPRKSDAVYRAARRSASTHMRERIEAAVADPRVTDRPEALAIRQVRETRRALERSWLATGEALRSQGETARADEVQRFVRNLPPARTEREWLRAEHIDRAHRPRAQNRERTR
ncbi:MAG: relaxase/mobilization nuclease domain-containing protein [Steroidobacteraceae bacterium]